VCVQYIHIFVYMIFAQQMSFDRQQGSVDGILCIQIRAEICVCKRYVRIHICAYIYIDMGKEVYAYMKDVCVKT